MQRSQMLSKTKDKKKSLGSATITSRSRALTPKGREKRHKPSRAKQTNARKNGTFPFQYYAEKKLDSMLFKRDL